MDTGLRTSTNSFIGGLVTYILALVASKFPALEPLASDPQVVAGLVAIVMWGVARVSKTQTNPGPI